MSSCANFKETNEMIADADAAMFTAYSTAAVNAAATPDSGDDVAIAFAFMQLMNNRQFFRPETALDYVNGTVKIAALALPWVDKWINGGGDTDTKYQAGRDVYVNSSRSSDSGFDMFNHDGTLNYQLPE